MKLFFRFVISFVLAMRGMLFGEHILQIEHHAYLMLYGHIVFTAVGLTVNALTE